MKYTNQLHIVFAASLSALSVNVLAHDGPLAHGGFHNSVVAGFMHPLTGVDHLAAMLLAGALLANCSSKKAIFSATAILIALLAGTALGAVMGTSQTVEWLVMASCFIFAAALVIKQMHSMTASAATVLLGSLFVVHGWAHGAELPAENITQFISGFLLAAVVLLVIGKLLMQAALELQCTFKSASIDK